MFINFLKTIFIVFHFISQRDIHKRIIKKCDKVKFIYQHIILTLFYQYNLFSQ